MRQFLVEIGFFFQVSYVADVFRLLGTFQSSPVVERNIDLVTEDRQRNVHIRFEHSMNRSDSSYIFPQSDRTLSDSRLQ